MRNLNKLLSGVVLSSLSVPVALAAVMPASAVQKVKITVHCPQISSKQTSALVNYGTYIAGTGFERVNGGPVSEPLFQGPIVPGSNIPTDLKAAHYKNHGVTYNPMDGAVVCKYKSSTSGNDPFNVSYLMANALNGTVAGSGYEEIHLKIPVGLK